MDCSQQPQAGLRSAVNGREGHGCSESLSLCAAVAEVIPPLDPVVNNGAHDPVLTRLRTMYARLKAEPVPDRLLKLTMLWV